MTNKDKFKALVSEGKSNTIENNRERIRNRSRLRESQQIALKVLEKLDEPGWSQRRLADEMEMFPQQITKIVSGKENLTLDTQIRLQEILDIPILATYYENKFEELANSFSIEETEPYIVPAVQKISFGEDKTLFTNQVTTKIYGAMVEDYQPYEKTA